MESEGQYLPETNQFRYAFTLKGMFAKKNEKDEGITLYSESEGECVGVIEAPYMNDATGKYTAKN